MLMGAIIAKLKSITLFGVENSAALILIKGHFRLWTSGVELGSWLDLYIFE